MQTISNETRFKEVKNPFAGVTKVAKHVAEDFAEKAEAVIEITDPALPRIRRQVPVTAFNAFVEKYPIISKLYFLSHLFALYRIGTTSLDILKHAKKVVIKSGMKRFDAVAKFVNDLSKMTNYFATLIIGLDALEVGRKLGELGIKAAVVTMDALGGCLDIIAGVGAVLGAAKIVIDGRKWWKTRQIIQVFESQPWLKADGKYTEKEYTLFKNHLEGMSDKEKKQFDKALGTSDFCEKTLEQMHRAVPTGGDIIKLRDRLETVRGKLKTENALHIVRSITAAVSVASSVCLFFPPLHPVAAVLIVAAAVMTFVTVAFSQINQYRFEDRLNLIDRPKQRMNGFQRFVDFTKWQLGLYDKSSILMKILNAGSKVCENGIHVGNVLAALLKAVDTARSALRL